MYRIMNLCDRGRGGDIVKAAACVSYVVIALLLAGCAKDEIISVALSRESMPVSGLRILVTDFSDLRSDRRRLGLKHSLFGSEDLFQVRDGT